MKKRILTMIMAGCVALSMCACGASGKETKKSDEGPTNYALMDYINDNGYIILIGTDEMNKDKSGYAMVLYEDGTYYSSYGASRHKLSTYSKKKDDKIIEDIKSQWKERKDKKDERDKTSAIEEICTDEGYSPYASYYESGDTSEIIGYFTGAFITYANCYIGGRSTDGIYDEMSNRGYDSEVTDYLAGIYNGINLDSPSEDEMKYLNCNTEVIDPLIEKNLLPNYISSASAACDKKIKDMESNRSKVSYDAGTYTITAITDASGNNVASEVINFVDGDSKSKIELESYLPTYAIYDCYYSGYSTGGNVLGTKLVAVRVDASNVMMGFDTVDTKGIKVD